MIFIHDNARPHTVRKAVDKLNELGFDVLPHPPYSPDLSPSHYYLFHPMKNALRGKQYNNSQEIVTDIIAWFQTKESGFFGKLLIFFQRGGKNVSLKNSNFFLLIHIVISLLIR